MGTGAGVSLPARKNVVLASAKTDKNHYSKDNGYCLYYSDNGGIELYMFQFIYFNLYVRVGRDVRKKSF